MKKSQILICILGFLLFSVTMLIGEEIVKFTPLNNNEIITFIKHDAPKNSNKYEVVFYAENEQKREIYRCSGFSFSFEKNSSINNTQNLIFSASIQNDIHETKFFKLFMLNGNEGTVKVVYSSQNFVYAFDTTFKFICIYDIFLSKDIPIIRLYSFPDMKILKEVKIEEFKDKDVFPKRLIFNKGIFTIDIMNDGLDYKQIKISILDL